MFSTSILACGLLGLATMGVPMTDAASTASVSDGVSWRALPLSQKRAYTFEHFEVEFNRQWANTDERDARRTIFEQNLANIHAQNDRFSAGHSTWRAGVNDFTDKTRAELPTGLAHSSTRGSNGHTDTRAHTASASSAVKEVPTSMDWRDKGVVTPVKDQGGCGSCWAFSATETVESAVAIATTQLIELAPQEMVDCVTNPHHCGGVGGCGGATQELGYAYVMLNGMATSTAYPYQARDGACMVGTDAKGKNVTAVAGVTGYTRVTPNDNGALLEAVATVGPVAISVDASWGSYESGVYDACPKTSVVIDHGVQVVGYGEDSGTLYWIVRNSWGSKWGDSGYIKLKRYATGSAPCYVDPSPSSGTGCDGGPPNMTVCGECGMLSDSSYPTGAFVFSK